MLTPARRRHHGRRHLCFWKRQSFAHTSDAHFAFLEDRFRAAAAAALAFFARATRCAGVIVSRARRVSTSEQTCDNQLIELRRYVERVDGLPPSSWTAACQARRIGGPPSMR